MIEERNLDINIDGPKMLRQGRVCVRGEVRIHIKRLRLMKAQIALAQLFFNIGTRILGCDLDWDISTDMKKER